MFQMFPTANMGRPIHREATIPANTPSAFSRLPRRVSTVGSSVEARRVP